jgi:hypothetical protein
MIDMIDLKRHCNIRKKLLIEQNKYLLTRLQLNKNIRRVQASLNALDRGLVVGFDEQ